MKSKFRIEQEFDDEPVYVLNEYGDTLVTIEAHKDLTPVQRGEIARAVVDVLENGDY